MKSGTVNDKHQNDEEISKFFVIFDFKGFFRFFVKDKQKTAIGFVYMLQTFVEKAQMVDRALTKCICVAII